MKSRSAVAGHSRLALVLVSLGFAPHSLAAPAIDGTDDGTEGYTTLASQTFAGFGDNNTFGTIKAVQEGNNLHVLLSGLVQNNAVILFIDSKPGGINSIAPNTITSGNEEFSINNLSGLTFETGFEADFAVRIFGAGDSSGAFHNTYNLTTGVRDYAGNSLGDPAPIATNVPIIDDFGTIWPSPPVNPATVVDGVELALDIAQLGVPTGTNDVKLLAFVTNGGSDFISDVVLGPLTASGNLGGPGGVNFETIAGVQTVTFSVTAANPDNDSDGLLNGVETNGGPDTFVDENDTGTDPNNPDTDGDYLGDGFEVTNFASLGTNPTLADSDADGVNDATELSLTGVANDASIPTGGATDLIGFDFFDYTDGGIDGATGFETRVFDFDNNVTNDPFVGHTGAVAPWSTSFGTQVICSRLLTDGSNATRSFNGAATGGSDLGVIENTISADSTAVFVKIDLTRLAGSTFSGVSFMNGGTEVAFAGVRDALNGSDRNFGVEVSGEAGSAFTGDIPVDRQPNTIVARLETSGTPSIAIWVDPDTSTASAPAPDAEASFVTAANAVATGIRIASGGRAYWDNLAVTTTWDELDAINPTDDDSDTLRDSWEELFAPGNLATLAPADQSDGDGLDNAGEQARGTNPLVDDTDGDGYNDLAETNTGTFVSSTDTGSDPCDFDTDDDTLRDGVETGSGTDNGPLDTGSNPNLADTDEDGENDGFEVFQGTNPNSNTSNSAALGLVQVNGVRDAGDDYGAHVAVQTVNTEFGDNQSELNAAYGRVQNGKLYLLLTGNLEDNFNKLEIFLDSKAGGQGASGYVPVDDPARPNEDSGVDGTTSMAGMFFETGFAADYHLICRRGAGKFDLDIIDLQAGTFSSYEDILSFGTFGYGATATGVNASPIRVGYDGSNTGGVVAGTTAAVEADALAVTTGLEICIDLADLGSPATEVRVMAMINNNSHDFLSNQVLGGLPAPSANLGNPAAVDFEFGIAGDQSFTISVLEPTGDFQITSVALIPGNKLQIEVGGLTSGSSYLLTESGDLSSFGTPAGAVTAGGSPAVDGQFTATGSTETLEVVLPAGTRAFYRVEDAP